MIGHGFGTRREPTLDENQSILGMAGMRRPNGRKVD
jgi:hypothetical protein